MRHIDRIRTLIPIDSLSQQGLDQLVRQLDIRPVERGVVLFEEGDTDHRTLFLLSGRVELDSGDRTETVEAGSEKARYALAGLKPRRYTATTRDESVLADIDTKTLDNILTMDQLAAGTSAEGYEVTEMENPSGDSDWMVQTIRTPVFLRLPAGNIQALFSLFEEIPVSEGQEIIREGETGDYFYLIKHGRCQVSRRPETGDQEVVFDQMQDGDSFGEDALLSGYPRNATVTMTSDGALMRLSKARFDELMKEPLIDWTDASEALALQDRDTVLVDVRTENEFRHGSIPGSRNLPLYVLRHKTRVLDPAKRVLVFCDTGNRSSAAAFLLTKEGFRVSVLRGGLAAMPESRTKVSG